MSNISKMTLEEIYTRLKTFDDISTKGIDTSTLHKKVVTGYQGWFNAPGDGAENKWSSWDGRNGLMQPGSCTIDLWPDMSEMDEDEKYPTGFQHSDGNTAHVFSTYNKKTVLRHFQWMMEYGIDTAFVQRFVVPLKNPTTLNHLNTVLGHIREGANQYGRGYNIMYDLSGMDSTGVETVINDWKNLVDNMGITVDKKDRAYQHHKERPVVAIWGVGFNDNRKYTLDDSMRLVKFFKDDPEYGNNTVMVGVPTGWREQSDEHFYTPQVKERSMVMDGDSLNDKYLHEIIKKADIVSPWTVDRFDSIDGAKHIARNIWAKDIQWCNKNNVEFMPVVFPGFSWSNLFKSEKLGQIPRLKGKFLWKQYYEAVKLGVPMVYQAMFDEVNEGTAIFKCTNNPPVGESKFLDYEGMPSDYYLWLVGMAAKMLREEKRLTEKIPERE